MRQSTKTTVRGVIAGLLVAIAGLLFYTTCVSDPQRTRRPSPHSRAGRSITRRIPVNDAEPAMADATRAHPADPAASSRTDAFSPRTTDRNHAPAYRPDELLVVFREDVDTVTQKRLHDTLGASIIPRPPFSRRKAVRVRLKPGMTVPEAMSKYMASGLCLSAEPNYLIYKAIYPNEKTDAPIPFQSLWAVENTGQAVDGDSGTPGVDMSLTGAWDTIHDASAVIVAVVDSGINADHEDFDKANLILPGYDFIDGDTDPFDEDGHGTHVSGIIGALGNNSKGVTGVCWKVRIMPLRVLDENGLGDDSDLADAIYYAIAHNADIINFSVGGDVRSTVTFTALGAAQQAGVLVVCAAGNENKDVDTDTGSFYPAAFTRDFQNILSVGATDQNDAKAAFSNYGASSVDVFAPGVNIYSTWHRKRYFVEDFDSAFPPAIPSSLSASGPNSTWGTAGQVLWSDVNSPYAANADGWVETNAMDVSLYTTVKLKFEATCQSEANLDYCDVSVYDGASWIPLHRFTGMVDQQNFMFDLTPYISSQLRVRFTWITNSTNNAYLGFCLDDLVIETNSNSAYRFNSGTSMAAPEVSGLAALIKARFPNAAGEDLKKDIEDHVTFVSALSDQCVTGGRVNATGTLADTTPPTGLQLLYPIAGESAPTNTPVLIWKTADFSYSGPAMDFGYKIELSDTADMSRIIASTTNDGTQTRWSLSGTTLSDYEMYWWRVTAKDGAGNISVAGPESFVKFPSKNTGGSCALMNAPISPMTPAGLSIIMILGVITVLFRNIRRRAKVSVDIAERFTTLVQMP